MQLTDLAQLLEDGLNVNSYGIVFDISANYKEFQKAYKNKRRNENAKGIVYGVLSMMTSEAVPVANLGNFTLTANLEIVSTTDNLILENYANIYEVLQDYYTVSIGTSQDSGSYQVGINLTQPTVDIERLNNLGGTLPMRFIVTFTVTKNAYTFNDVTWKLDNTVMSELVGWNMIPIKEQEAMNTFGGTIKKNVFKSEGLSFSFTLPHSTSVWFQNVFDDVYKNRTLNKAYTLTYEDPKHSGAGALTWYVGIVQMPIAGSPQKANGVAMVLAEMREDLVLSV